MLELREMRSIPSFLLLSSPFWLRVVELDRVLSMDQIELRANEWISEIEYKKTKTKQKKNRNKKKQKKNETKTKQKMSLGLF